MSDQGRGERIARGRAVAASVMARLPEIGREVVRHEPRLEAWLAARGERLRKVDDLTPLMDGLVLGLSSARCTRASQGKAAGQARQAQADHAHNQGLRADYRAAIRAGEVREVRAFVPVSLENSKDRALIRVTLKRERRRLAREAA